MRRAAPEWRRLLGAAAIGAMIAFPAGWVFSGRGSVQPDASEPERPGAATPPEHGARNPFSPVVLGDPYVEAQHRKAAQAIETSCRRTGQLCAEAELARQYLRRLEAGSGR